MEGLLMNIRAMPCRKSLQVMIDNNLDFEVALILMSLLLMVKPAVYARIDAV